MWNLAGAGDAPAVGMVVGFADRTDLNTPGIMGLDRVQAVRADVFFNARELNIIFLNFSWLGLFYPFGTGPGRVSII
jgi:hypothetical protein